MKNKKLLRQRRNAFWSALYAAVIYALFYIPVLVMIQFSFNDAKRNYSWEGLTSRSVTSAWHMGYPWDWMRIILVPLIRTAAFVSRFTAAANT